MSLNLRRRNKMTGEVFVGSLNDIMFFLLLFFLITSTMATPNVLKLLLPNAKTSHPAMKHPVTVAVTADMQYAVNDEIVSFEKLESTIIANLAGQEDPTVILKVDKSVQVQGLVDLLDIGARNKIKMVLATNTVK